MKIQMASGVSRANCVAPQRQFIPQAEGFGALRMTVCRCYVCEKARVERSPPAPEEAFGGHDMRLGRMFLCDLCGNKRCPHAADHRLDCTRSNAPGQRGSLYENAPAFEPPEAA